MNNVDCGIFVILFGGIESKTNFILRLIINKQYHLILEAFVKNYDAITSSLVLELSEQPKDKRMSLLKFILREWFSASSISSSSSLPSSSTLPSSLSYSTSSSLS